MIYNDSNDVCFTSGVVSSATSGRWPGRGLCLSGRWGWMDQWPWTGSLALVTLVMFDCIKQVPRSILFIQLIPQMKEVTTGRRANLELSRNGGIKNGCFIMESPIQMDDDWG